MMKKVVVTREYFLTTIPQSCQDVAQFFRDEMAEVPEEYQGGAKALFSVDRDGDIEVEIFYERPETEEEKKGNEFLHALDRERRKEYLFNQLREIEEEERRSECESRS